MSKDKKLKPFAEIPESFTALKDNEIYYTDKTAFIPYLVNQERRICVFTRPRRFGKTLMLRTLQTFFEYRLDEDGKPVDNRYYFEGLKVMDAGDDVLKEMGQYPVISLSFKEMRNDSLEEMADKLRIALADACDVHAYLLNHPSLREAERKEFRELLDKCEKQSGLETALSNLCNWIYKATKRKTVILIDEYDVPLQQAAIYDIRHPGTCLYEKVVKLVGNFISSGFKSNNNLAYGIIAGCMRVAKESIFTGMNNPGVITVLDDIPDEYWGFTQPEVEKMLAYYGLSDKMNALKHWYEGYYYSDREVYNPWSLLNAIRSLVNGYEKTAIQSYWARTSGNDIIDDMIERNPDYRLKLAQIMNGEPLWAHVFQDLSYRDLKIHPESIWSFLLYTGYLKAIKKRLLDTGNWEALVTIPNMEIRSVMNQSMVHWWKDIYLPSVDGRPLMEAMDSANIECIEREINLLLDHGMSCFDYNEAFYHGTLYAILQTAATRVKSNAEFGEGRPDIVAFGKEKAFILELKRVSGKELKTAISHNQDSSLDAWDIEDACMENKLDEAERQIKEGRYLKGVLREYPIVREAVCYAICFCKKRCMVREVSMK